MIKGLYSAASAMITGVYRQQAIAHDIANIDTPGFKQILTSLNDFDKTNVYTQKLSNTSTSPVYLGELGLGVMASLETNDFSQGTLKNTDSQFDFAIEGSGFFRINTAEGERFTRDGRFARDASGQLVTVDGNPVLSTTGQPIKLPEGDISVASDGTISSKGTTVGKIGMAYFADVTTLTRENENRFSSTTAPLTTGGGSILQSTLEQSNVDTAKLITQMIEISRSYQAAQQMVQNQDELLGKSIATLGRIS